MGQAIRPSTEGQARQSPPLVSVVIPCFDQAHFLTDAIESVFAQTFRDFELLVVDDDGSDDNSYEVARRYPDVRPLRQANRGVAAARNLGLGESRGAFSIFLDADDRLLPHALELGMEALVKRPQIAFAAGMSRDIREDGQPIDGADRQPLVTQDHYLRLLEDCYIWSGSSVVYRRSAIDAVGGFNESLEAADDYELYLKLAHRYPVYCHDEVVTEYRRHGSNTTRNAAVVLTSQLEVLRGQRSQVRGGRERAARRVGIRKTRAEHGHALAEQVAANWRRRQWRQVMRQLRTLARHDPGGLLGLASRAA
jgi:glycosyltransferase involved in cell wall biosynthesis